MDKQRVFSILLILGGLGGLLTASIGTGGSNVVVLATVSVVGISLGLLVTGGTGIFRQNVGIEVYTRAPAGTLLLLGLTDILGGLVLFYPTNGSVTYGLQMILTAVLVLVGGVLLYGGWRWSRQRQMRYPLGLLAGGFVLGVSYLLHQRLDIFVSNLRLALIAVVALFVAVAMPYLVPARPANPTGE